MLSAELAGVGHDDGRPCIDVFLEQLLLPTGDLGVDAVVREHARHSLAAVVGGVPRVERVCEGRGVTREDGDDHQGRQDPETDQERRTPR